MRNRSALVVAALIAAALGYAIVNPWTGEHEAINDEARTDAAHDDHDQSEIGHSVDDHSHDVPERSIRALLPVVVARNGTNTLNSIEVQLCTATPASFGYLRSHDNIGYAFGHVLTARAADAIESGRCTGLIGTDLEIEIFVEGWSKTEPELFAKLEVIDVPPIVDLGRPGTSDVHVADPPARTLKNDTPNWLPEIPVKTPAARRILR